MAAGVSGACAGVRGTLRHRESKATLRTTCHRRVLLKEKRIGLPEDFGGQVEPP